MLPVGSGKGPRVECVSLSFPSADGAGKSSAFRFGWDQMRVEIGSTA